MKFIFFRSYGILEKESFILKEKYENAVNLFESMLQPLFHKRPNCEKILHEKYLWALTEEEIENFLISNKVIANELFNIIGKEDSEIFIYSILRSKLDKVYLRQKDKSNLLN